MVCYLRRVHIPADQISYEPNTYTMVLGLVPHPSTVSWADSRLLIILGRHTAQKLVRLLLRTFALLTGLLSNVGDEITKHVKADSNIR